MARASLVGSTRGPMTSAPGTPRGNRYRHPAHPLTRSIEAVRTAAQAKRRIDVGCPTMTNPPGTQTRGEMGNQRRFSATLRSRGHAPGGRRGGADPDASAAKVLPLPDGDGGLQAVDEPAAGPQTPRHVPGRYRHPDAHLPHRDHTGRCAMATRQIRQRRRARPASAAISRSAIPAKALVLEPDDPGDPRCGCGWSRGKRPPHPPRGRARPAPGAPSRSRSARPAARSGPPAHWREDRDLVVLGQTVRRLRRTPR
jgi:hypothetical protein